MLGEQISHYRLESKLGSGTYGVVYKGVHVGDEELKVAIKVVQPSLLDDPKFVEALKKECRRLDKLDHAAIVRFQCHPRMQMKPRLAVTKTTADTVLYHQRSSLKQPLPRVHRLAGQTAIAIMAANHLHTALAHYLQPQRPSPPRHPEARPHLRRTLPIHHHRVVGRRLSLTRAFRIQAVTRRSRIHQHPLPEYRKLERQGIGMGMPRQVIWPNRRHIQQRDHFVLRHTHVAALR